MTIETSCSLFWAIYGVWILFADVSEHCSIFIGGLTTKKNRDEIVGVFFLLTAIMKMEQTVLRNVGT